MRQACHYSASRALRADEGTETLFEGGKHLGSGADNENAGSDSDSGSSSEITMTVT